MTVKVALLGCGVVGREVARLLLADRTGFGVRIGDEVELVGIAVRRLGKARGLDVDPTLFTDDARALVARDDLDVVVEVIGGIEPAGTLIRQALESGASVVTANKALLADDGPSLFALADKVGRDLYFEAAVAGAIPIIRPLRESLAGDVVHRVVGIVNGTTNFILDLMQTSGMGFEAALEEAQQLGYAEADPTADIEGFDAAAKAAIISSLAFHAAVSASDVYREGITGLTAHDLQSAARLGCVVKLVAICEQTRDPQGRPLVSARVHPAMIPADHPLAGVRGANNAVLVECESAGQLMFYGPGAGGAPTASAVLGDLVGVARNRVGGVTGTATRPANDADVLPMAATRTRYHVVLDVDDRPGVLARVATAFADRDVSIETLQQDGRGDEARLVVVTHTASDSVLRATVDSLEALDSVHAVTSVLRVEGL